MTNNKYWLREVEEFGKRINPKKLHFFNFNLFFFVFFTFNKIVLFDDRDGILCQKEPIISEGLSYIRGEKWKRKLFMH